MSGRSYGIKFPASRTSGPSDVRIRKEDSDRKRYGKHAFYPMEGAFTPGEALDYLDSDPMVCLYCGKGFQLLGRHLIATHGVTSREYCDQYLIPWSVPTGPNRRAQGLATKGQRLKLSERSTPETRAWSSARMKRLAGTWRRPDKRTESPGVAAARRASAKCHMERTCEFCGKRFTSGRSGDATFCSKSCSTKHRHAKEHFGRHGKLSEADVIAIRESAVPVVELAARYGVFATLVSQIQLGQVYSHYAGPIRKAKHGGPCLEEADVLAIRASDESREVLEERFGVCSSTISNVLLGRTWAHVGGRILEPAGPLEIGPDGRFLPRPRA